MKYNTISGPIKYCISRCLESSKLLSYSRLMCSETSKQYIKEAHSNSYLNILFTKRLSDSLIE